MNKKILVILVAVILVVAIGATAGIVIYDNSRPYTVWTNITYAGSTPIGTENETLTNTLTPGTMVTYFTYYNYTFSVKTNTLSFMTIHDHCATVIPNWSSAVFASEKINSGWIFNVAYNETGPVDWITASGHTIQEQAASSPPLTQAQIDAINADFQSQNVSK